MRVDLLTMMVKTIMTSYSRSITLSERLIKKNSQTDQLAILMMAVHWTQCMHLK